VRSGLLRNVILEGAIPNAPHSLDQVRAAQLLAQLRDVDVDRTRAACKREPPDALEQPIAGDDLACMLRELGEQFELQRAQGNDRPGNRHAATPKVDSKVAQLDHARFPRGRLGAPENRPDPRNELARRERLGQVVVGSQLEAQDPIDLLVPGGEDQNRHASPSPQLLADFDSVQVGQTEIEDDEARVTPLDGLEAALARALADDLEACLLQVRSHQLADGLVVLDHDHNSAHGLNALIATTNLP
jgi:hypothetical protein